MSSNKVKGDNYEVQIRNHIICNLNKRAYLWDDTPEDTLIRCGLIGSHNENRLKRKENKLNPLLDTGIDIIQMEDENTCSLVQCKNGYKGGVTISDLAGFYSWIVAFETSFGYVYYTSKLSQHILYQKKSSRVTYIKVPYVTDIIVKKTVQEIIPYDYQIECVQCFSEKFERRGILSLPCGTGKTLISYMISKRYKQIIILSPLRQSAFQNLFKFVEYGYPNKTVLVDSDGVRDVEELKKIIEENDSFLLSATFCSIDVIYKCLPFMKDPFIIVDEFHNITKNNVTNEEDDFNKVLNSEVKMLFISATPRIYEMETENDDNEEIFGEIIYNMSFSEAIEKKYITDYKLWLPSIHEDNEDLNKELTIYEIDSTIKAKCQFFFSSLVNTGIKKCIVYCVDTNEIRLMMDAMDILNDFYCLDYDMSQITCGNNEKTRITILDNFAKETKIQLLFSVRILDECIDIPSCDSIFITYPSQSKIRNIQRMNRATRNDKSNPFKIANIFIWCREYDEILTTLSGLKEYDPFFKDKIQLINSNYFGNSDRKIFDEDVNVLNDRYIIGIKEYRQITFDEKLENLVKFIEENKRRPSSHSKNKDEKILGSWLSTQQKHYKKNEGTMKNEDVRKKYEDLIEKYKEYFQSNDEKWDSSFDKTVQFIEENNKLPTSISKNKDEKILGSWLSSQQKNYKKNEGTMKNEDVRKKYEDFIEKYKEYFESNDEKWDSSRDKTVQFIEENNKLPSKYSKNKDEKFLGKWLSTQQYQYKKNEYIMKNEDVRKKYEDFIEKYKEYFESNDEKWDNSFDKTVQFIEENNKLPSKNSKNKDEKILGSWLSHQQQNYKKNEKIMKNEDTRKKLEDFIGKYKEYFESNGKIIK
jgi:superfamily II DNA or RNA helicase/predicted small secreted protein